tara:strand:- start:1008 stop:1988 length:981 start_codon:yes stop_codon:yes gene_type:complete
VGSNGKSRLAITLQHVQRRVREAVPDDGFGRLTETAIVLLIIANVIAVMLESVAAIGAKYQREFYVFEVFSIAVFSLEYATRLVMSPAAGASRGEAFAARLRYVFSVHGLIDLIAIAPFYLGMFGATDLRFLRALRLFRILKLTRYSPAISMLYRSIGRERDAIAAALCLLSIALVITSCGIYLCEHTAQPEAFGSIPAAIWWAIATLTTVGYGDVTPITTGGKIFGAGVMILGVGMVALPTAILASTFVDELHRRREEFASVVGSALEDGALTGEECEELDALRARLGMSDEDANEILNYVSATRERVPRTCPHCGARTDTTDAS